MLNEKKSMHIHIVLSHVNFAFLKSPYNRNKLSEINDI